MQAPDSRLRAVIFDCDGVLFDSWRANVAFYNAVLGELGRPPMGAERERLAHMLSTPQFFAAMFPGDDALIAHACTVARDLDYTPFYHWMQPAPGLHQLLGDLKRCYRLAMATNRGVTTRGVVQHFGLGEFLELAVGIVDVARPKPFPDMIEKCIAHFNIAADEAVYVGDTQADRDAAQAAGVHFVGIGPDTDSPLRITHLAELPALLRQGSAVTVVD